MQVFEIIIALLLSGTLLAAIARRFATPYPALLALAGAGLALIPGVPTLVLDPELALALFVAPVLLDTAFDASQRDLRTNWRSVASLALGAVVLTVAAVAVLARMLVPDMPWAVAIALGAIVAPPDAAAATAVLRQLRPPHQLLVILEGESLFNDASALLIYRLAVGAALAGAISGWAVLPTLLVISVGSVILGLILSRISVSIFRHIHDIASAIIVQFCSAFAVWILAERLHLSGILTMVVYAMAASRSSSDAGSARIRIPSFVTWEVGVFVLNVLAFILVGFQLKGITARLDQATLIEYTGVATAVCVATILARIVWVSGASAFSRLLGSKAGGAGPSVQGTLSSRAAVVVAWCGMRGTVTLAAALALPTGGEGGIAFPFRDLILFTAFAVVLVTLVIQGMTLRPLIARLQLQDDGEVDHEVRLARVETLRAALSAVSIPVETTATEIMRRRYELLLGRAEAALANRGNDQSANADSNAREASLDAEMARAAVNAERHRLYALRADGTIGDSAFQLVQQDIDLEELDLDQVFGERGYNVVH